jgi:transcriptional regulator with XRE-family HTH domain
MNVILEKRFVERLSEAMKAADINQSELARRMNVTRSMVNQYLNGRIAPGLDVVERFAAALEVDPLALLSSEKVLVNT